MGIKNGSNGPARSAGPFGVSEIRVLVFCWAHAGEFFEGAGEVGDVFIAHGFGDLVDAELSLLEKRHGLLHPAAREITPHRTVGLLLEQVAQVSLAQAQACRHLPYGQAGVRAVSCDIVHRLLHIAALGSRADRGKLRSDSVWRRKPARGKSK